MMMSGVCGLGLLCWIHLYVCGPAFPHRARVYLSACVCGGWFGSQLRFNVCVCLTEYFIRNVCYILVSIDFFFFFFLGFQHVK